MPAFSRIFTGHPLRLVVATLVFAVAGGLALTVKAAPHGPGGAGMPMMMMAGPAHIDHMLDAVNATADQRSQIKAILDAAHTDLKAQRESARSLHEQAMTLFTQPTVDARAAETLRQQMMAQHDQASKRMMQAMLDVSRVLSVDQRQQLATQMAAHRAAWAAHHAASAAAATK